MTSPVGVVVCPRKYGGRAPSVRGFAGAPEGRGEGDMYGVSREARGWRCRGGAGPHRENWPEVGVPGPSLRFFLIGIPY